MSPKNTQTRSPEHPEFKDILGSHLLEDKRVELSPIARKKIYSDGAYEVHLCLYPGIDGHKIWSQRLLAALYIYKQEALRIMLKVHLVEGEDSPEEIFKDAVSKFEAEEKTPIDMIRSAKKWCNVPFTDADLEAFAKK